MNQTQAINKLRKSLGDKLAWRIDKGAPDADEREAFHAEWKAAKEAADQAAKALQARMDELLSDPLYRELKAKAKQAQTAAETASYKSRQYRITVGLDQGYCFSVRAEGDNWADVVAKVEAKAA